MNKKSIKEIYDGFCEQSPQILERLKTYQFTNQKQQEMLSQFTKNISFAHLKNNALRLREWYAKDRETLPVDPKLILFESREGNGFVGNPYAFYKYLQQDPRFKDYTFCWVYHEDVNLEDIKDNLESLENTIFVQRKSREYSRMLATAGYIFNNTTTLNMFSKREGQTFISTWHGTPLKSLAFDSPFDWINPFPIRNGMRNFLMADYLIGPNEHTSNVLLNAYKINGLFDGKVLESGYPRIDLTFNTPKEVVLEKLAKANVTLDLNKPTIMYTPTWRGRFLADADVDIDQMKTEVELLREYVKDRYNLLIKVHPVAYNKIHADGSLDDILVPNWADANEVMTVADLLITDYSSIFFDYMVTDKPILFYCWDDDIYSKNRNMYLDLSTLPGPILHTMVEVMLAIDNIDEIEKQYRDKYEAMKQLLLPYDDGHSTERDVNAIFFGNEEQENLVIRQGIQNKKRLLFYVGNLKNNMITNRFFYVLSKIDFDQYDVTALINPPKDDDRETWENLRKIVCHVRPMFRQGYSLFTMSEILDDMIIKKYGLSEETMNIYPKEAYENEANRVFGGCRFDVAIDFVGDSVYWSRYILESNADTKIIFQQYDMKYRWNNLKSRAAKQSLKSVMTLYTQYSRVLCASKAYLKNREYSREYIIPECYSSVNLPDDPVFLNWPIYQKDHSTNMKEVRYEATVVEEGVHTLIPDIQKMTDTIEVTLTLEDKIDVVMEATEEGETYIKLLVNNVYFGWGKATEYQYGLNQIQEVVPVRRQAVITPQQADFIYEAPKNTREDILPICSVNYLQGLVVEIDERVITKDGVYAHILANGKEIGYLLENQLKMRVMLPKWIAENQARYANKVADVVMEQLTFDDVKGQIQSSEATLYSYPKGNFLSTVLENQSMAENQEIVTILREVKTKAGVSYQVKDQHGMVAWIAKEDITLL